MERTSFWNGRWGVKKLLKRANRALKGINAPQSANQLPEFQTEREGEYQHGLLL